MIEPLMIAVAQPVSRLGDIRHNVDRHVALIQTAKARVVVFPELSLTGYAMDAETIQPTDDRLRPLVAACAHSDSIALVGGATAGAAGRRRISMLRVDEREVRVVYSKRWLGGDEPDWFEAGDETVTIVVDGWRLGLAICKDTGTVEHTAATATLGIDVYVAGACESEADRDVQRRRAAQIISDYRVPVAVACFAGPTGGGFGDTSGRSAIWRADGSTAAQAGREPGTVVNARLDRP